MRFAFAGYDWSRKPTHTACNISTSHRIGLTSVSYCQLASLGCSPRQRGVMGSEHLLEFVSLFLTFEQSQSARLGESDWILLLRSAIAKSK